MTTLELGVVPELGKMPEKMKAVVIRLNSPGGAVAPSQEIYEKVKAFKKPIVASMLVSVNGATLKRSKLNGFDYSASKNQIAIYGSATPKVGTNVVISYQKWK